MSIPPKTAKARKAATTVGKALRITNVTVLVTKFVDVLTSEAPQNERNTDYQFVPPKNRSDGGKLSISPDKLQILPVKGGGATFCFRIRSKNRSHTYYPLGIAFRRRNNRGRDNDKGDILGRKNFSFASMHLWGRSLYITDNFKDCGQGDRYKFSIIIQRQHDAAIGIIDPDLVHTSSHP